MTVTNTQLQDKTSYAHIFAGLIKNPYVLNQYKININDFPEKFHQILFSAIYNLFQDGAETLSAVTIDGYLKDMPTQYKIFEDGYGIDYIEQCLEYGEERNFGYHFLRVKKFSLLRRYNALGLNVLEFYDPSFKEYEQEKEVNRRFNSTSLSEMMRHFEGKLLEIKDEFVFEEGENQGGHISKNIDEVIDSVMKKPNYGLPFSSNYYTTATRGARKRKFYCCSGSTGSGKTRKGMADLCQQCIPIIYDEQKGLWTFTGNNARGLFISTELEWDEVAIPACCYIANVEEDNFHAGEITPEEAQRLRVAKRIVEKSNLYLEILMDFDVDDIEHLIQKYINKYGTEYVFFDYIHTTVKMFEYMAKRGAKALAEHQILRILSIQLKNICNKYNIWLGTATQLNSKWKDDGNINLDEHAIEGSKSVANKFDVGAIQIPLTAKDEDLWEEIKTGVKSFGYAPTHTINIYKNRGNRWKFIRIWVHFNMGTLRTYDLCVTDYRGRVLENIQAKKIVFEEQRDFELDVDDTYSDKDIQEIIEQVISEFSSGEEIELEENPFNEKEADMLKREFVSIIAESSTDEDNYTEDELPESFFAQDTGFGVKKTEISKEDSQKRFG